MTWSAARRAYLNGQSTYATTATESRLLDLVRFSPDSVTEFAAGQRRGTITALAQEILYPSRAVKLWQLLADCWAVSWFDATAGGVCTYDSPADAIESYNRILHALQSRPAPQRLVDHE